MAALTALPRVRRLRDLMRPGSRLRYLAWRAAGARRTLTIGLRDGDRLIVRPAPAGDLSVAYEIFVDELYRSPRPLAAASVRRIVDVGANVGYALSYLGRRFPLAQMIAFEPHPAHLDQLDRNVAANGLTDRVTVIGAAAGLTDGRAFLSDAGEASRVLDGVGAGRLPILVADFFTAVGGAPIDLLKMDCEGGEYDLIMNQRFADLRVRAIALEWHAGRDRPEADESLRQRLAALDYALERGVEHRSGEDRFGMLWAYRKSLEGAA
jgi:FkbM family methyltransferase